MKRTLAIAFILSSIVNATNFYYENGEKIEVTQLPESRNFEGNSSNTITYYKTSKGHKVGVVNEILLKCHTGIVCEDVLKKYETNAIQKLSDTIFLIEVDKDKNIFKVSQTLYEDKDIEFAHPNFIKSKKRR